MSDTETLRLKLPFIIANQAQKHLTLNEGLDRLDVLVQARALSRTLSIAPSDPEEGDVYIRPESVTDTDWLPFPAHALLRLQDGYWSGFDAPEGSLCFVADEAAFCARTPGGWMPLTATLRAIDRIDHLGVGAEADPIHRLFVKGSSVLFSDLPVAEEGSGDFTLALNKESTGRTVQVLWQSGFASRLIVGLLGDDDLTLKSSADGERFVEALRIQHRSGRVRFCARPYVTPDLHKRAFVQGASWLSSLSAADNDWCGVAHSPELGLFVAVAASGSGNRVMTSPDGIAWTARASDADNDWQSVVWAAEAGLFVAVAASGTGNRVMTSSDGVTWTARASVADNGWASVAYGRECGRFVAVAVSGVGDRVMTSPDGVNWTPQASGADNDWRSVVWAAELGLFVAVASSGTGNRVMTSPDGESWTLQSAPDRDWQTIIYAPELERLVAVASSGSGDRVMTSGDGVTWSLGASAADHDWRAVTFAPEIGLFAAVASSGSGGRVMTSPDGFTWTLGASAADRDWRDVVFDAATGLLVAVASSGTGDRVMTSVSAHACAYRA